MHMRVSLGDREMIALVDTGSALTLISRSEWKRGGCFPKELGPSTDLVAFGGETISTVGSFSSMLKISDRDCPVRVSVVPAGAMLEDLVIGRDVLNGGVLSVYRGRLSRGHPPKKSLTAISDPPRVVGRDREGCATVVRSQTPRVVGADMEWPLA